MVTLGIACGLLIAATALAAFWYGIGPIEYLIDRDTLHHF